MTNALALTTLLCAFASAAGPDEARLAAMQARFAPADIDADVSALPEGERRALAKLVRAAEVMDGLYLRQVWAGNDATLLGLVRDGSPLGRARRLLFATYKGPWDRQDHDAPFLPGAPAKPEGADFYPEDATKEEVARWVDSLPAEEKARAAGFFTVVRRGPGGSLRAVPYSVEYQNGLLRASRLLKDAAALTAQPTLKAYLEKRAAAFLSDDYYDSDVAWMELDSPIEPTIGPYETYEDSWFSWKAAFEAFIAVRDEEHTRRLQSLASELQWLEDNLPVDAARRNPKLGALAPIRVVDQVYAAGDAAKGVTTAAFNLPNDEKVTREKGSKRTMLKNVQRAKFDVVLTPISRRVLSAEDQGRVDFDAFFTHILMHELMHGLGPHESDSKDGSKVAVRQALKEASSALEEAKADIAGLWALQKLVDKGVLDKRMEETMYATYLASAFRTLRFGTGEAHGKGMALQVNWLMDEGAVTLAKDGTFALRVDKVKPAVESLTREIMMVQARGDYGAAKKLLARLGVLRPAFAAALERLKDLPVDIAPRHPAAERLLAEFPEG